MPGGEESALKYYKGFKVKYIKCLELNQLIKKEVIALEMRVPKNCIDIIENIKRFIKIMENNERNSTNNQSNQRSRVSRA